MFKTHKKRINKNLQLFISFLLLSVSTLQAQESVLSSGGSTTGNGGSMSYSIGQVTYTAIGSNGTVTQGVQQVYKISTVLGMELTNITLDVSIYPNPTTDYLNLKVENDSNKNLNYQLFDITGKLLITQKLTANSAVINMTELRTSTYLLKIVDNKATIKTFRIIKN